MRTHQICIIEHFFKDGVDHDIDPTDVTSEFSVSYSTELQKQIAFKAIADYITAFGLPPLTTYPRAFLPDGMECSNDLPYNEEGAGYSTTEGPNHSFAVYTAIV